MSKKRSFKIEVKPKLPRFGHINHRNGGCMDNREKKMRTRKNINDREIRDSRGEE